MKKIFLTLFLTLSVALVAHAEGGTQTNLQSTIPNPFKTGGTLADLFTVIAEKIILPIGGVLAVLAFIYSGFMFVTARGDEGKIKTARTALLYTAIGTVILLGATVIAKVLDTTVQSLK